MSKTLTADEFFNALENDTLGELLPIELPTLLTVSGFVKSSGADEVKFALSTLCAMWIGIPKKIIKSVQYLGKRPCASGMHDYAKLELTVPISDPIVTAFAGLANAYSAPTDDYSLPENEALGFFNSGNERLAPFPNTTPQFWGPRIPTPRLPRFPNPSKEVKCAACVAGWAIAAGIIAGWAASTGGIGVTLLGEMIITEFGVSSAVAHTAAAVAIAGGTVGAIASAMCPACN